MTLKIQELESAYKNAYKLKLHSEVRISPKIITQKSKFTASEKASLVSKRWTFYYEYRNPETGNMERVPPRAFEINRIKDFDERRKKALWICEALTRKLDSGWSPFQTSLTENELFSCEGAIRFAMEHLKQKVTIKTYKDYDSRVSGFIKFLKRKRIYQSAIVVINKAIVIEFLDLELKKTSATNRNNTRAALSSVFTVLSQRNIIERNFILDIAREREVSSINQPFTNVQQSNIEKHLTENDPYLLKFVQVFSWQFIRPIDVCRLYVGSIDLENRFIWLDFTKNQKSKRKLIPEILIPIYRELMIGGKPDDLLFTPNDCPGYWSRVDFQRREYFGKRFKRRVIDPLGLGANYKMYGFRHTIATRLFNDLNKDHTFEKSIDLFMSISGHKTRKAALVYLKQIDAILPEDWSDRIK